jgi:hypothetical protein
MKDITPFLSPSQIKPELAHVYVHDGLATATDGYRLIEIKLDEFLLDKIPDGFYTAKNWKAMTKAYNAKRQDLMAFDTIVKENNATAEDRSSWHYPDYAQLLPTPDKLHDIEPKTSLNRDYFIDFLKAIPADQFHIVDLSQIKDTGKMLYYQNDNIKILLMKCAR